MPEEITSTATDVVSKTSDGSVKIAVEKYNELLVKIVDQKGLINTLTNQLYEARAKPPVINRTIVEKTAEMAAAEHRAWGGSLMGLGAAFIIVGALRYKAGQS